MWGLWGDGKGKVGDVIQWRCNGEDNGVGKLAKHVKAMVGA